MSGIVRPTVLYARAPQLWQPLQIQQIFIFDRVDHVPDEPNISIKPEC